AHSQLLGIAAARDILRDVRRALTARRCPRGDEKRCSRRRDGKIRDLLARLQINRLQRQRITQQSLRPRDAVGADPIANCFEKLSLLLLETSALSLRARRIGGRRSLPDVGQLTEQTAGEIDRIDVVVANEKNLPVV